MKYRNRHSAIYLCADEAGQPTIDVLDGIEDTDFAEGIRSSGIYCTNGYFKGTIGLLI